MQDVYKYIDEYNIDRGRKILLVFDDMMAYMINNKKLNSVVTELFIRGRKLNISLVFITQSYFNVSKDVKTEYYSLFYHKNSTRKRTSTNYIKSFIRY